MIKILIKKFIPDYTNVNDKKIREKYGVLGGVLGIICNLFLFSVKLIIGIFMNSIAIISDAINNLSDTGSSIVSIFGAKMSNRQPDKEHPFGHGRIEYIASLIVSMIIMIVGVELLKTSVSKIIHPEPIKFSLVLIVILILSLSVKLWMFSYNTYISKAINSSIQKATAADSINDVFATSAVIISTAAGYLFKIQIDGYIGFIVSVLVLYSGFKISKDTVDMLLGTPPSPELVKDIQTMVLSGEDVIGVHDLIIHDYGPGRAMASVHAEVPDTVNITKIHEVIDSLEQKVLDELGVHLVIHMDPISNNCEKTKELKEQVMQICADINSEFTIHDFRITDGENQINLIFDLVVPFELNSKEKSEAIEAISKKLIEIDSKYNCVIKIDNKF